MAKGEVLGHMACLCGFPDGEVKEDKNGNPYFFCPDCTIQILTHGGPRGKIMLSKMRPVTPPAVEPQPVPVPEKKDEKPKRGATLLG